MIEIDGEHMEGGGQIARTALALSALTSKSFQCNNIRKNRPQPGLKAQHLTAINALQKISGIKTNDVGLGSTELRCVPGKIKGGIFDIDIGTAGSITLLLQAVLPPILFGPRKTTLNIVGGTCGKWQAPVEYLQHVLVPQLRRFCKKLDVKILKRGYFPKGGGRVTLEVTPRFSISNSDITGFLEQLEDVRRIRFLEQGKLEQIKGVSHASLSLEKAQVGERQAESAKMQLEKYGVPLDIRVEYSDSLNAGSGITLWGVFSNNGEIDDVNPVILGADALGERGKPAKEVGEEAANSLIKEIDSGAACDVNMGDQLLPFLGLLPGSEINVSGVSMHARTNMYVIEKFLPVRFDVTGNVLKAKLFK